MLITGKYMESIYGDDGVRSSDDGHLWKAFWYQIMPSNCGIKFLHQTLAEILA